MSTQQYALVEPREDPQRARHYRGLPPPHDEGDRQALPTARLLVIKQTSGGFMLYRYSAQGAFSGDTWHATLEEARDQATYEYGDALGPWIPIPWDVTDVVQYGLASAGTTSDD